MEQRRVAVIADSIACIPKRLAEQYGISILPLNFYVNGTIYKDGIDVSPADAYKLFLKDPKAFKTSGASPRDCLEMFRGPASEGKDIFCVVLSARLSAQHNIAHNAGEQIKVDYPGSSVAVFDSETAAAAEGLIALAAAGAAAQGKNLSEVNRIATKVRDKVAILAYMDTVRYIYRSGRIPRIASVAGSMLKIKPIFTFSEGVPHFLATVISKKIGVDRLVEGMKERVGVKPVHVAVMHVYAEDDAVRLRDRVANEFSCTELWLTEFSPLMGYACGTGALGLAFYPED